MKAIYGICNINPMILDSYIAKYERIERVKLKKQIIESNRASIKRGVDIVFSQSFKSLSINLKQLNKSKAVVLVFDSPLLLSSVGMNILDAIVNKDMTKHKFINFSEDDFIKRLKHALSLDTNVKFNPIKTSMSSSYLLYNKGESITQALLSITLPASDEYKKRITVTLVNWLLDKNRDMKGLIESMCDYVEPESLILLNKFLLTDVGKNTIGVFDAIEKGMSEKEIKSLCRTKGVPSFDVLYLLSQINSNRRGK